MNRTVTKVRGGGRMMTAGVILMILTTFYLKYSEQNCHKGEGGGGRGG